MRVDEPQLRVRRRAIRLQANCELEQTCHASCRLRVSDVGLHAAHSQRLGHGLASREYRTNQ